MMNMKNVTELLKADTSKEWVDKMMIVGVLGALVGLGVGAYVTELDSLGDVALVGLTTYLGAMVGAGLVVYHNEY